MNETSCKKNVRNFDFEYRLKNIFKITHVVINYTGMTIQDWTLYLEIWLLLRIHQWSYMLGNMNNARNNEVVVH